MNIKVRLFGALVFILLLTGCSYFKSEEAQLEYQNETVEELYENARQSLTKGDWNTALKRLRTLEAKYPYGPYAEQAQLDAIYAYYQLGRTESAVDAADRFIRLYPTNKSVDYAYYMKGLSSYLEDDSALGRFKGINDISDRDPIFIKTALDAFTEVYTLFPGSQYAPDSRRRVQYLLESIAKNEISIANYYYTQEAYVAVVNRAKEVIENYSSTPYVEVALAMMMFSYQHMGFTDLSADTRQVLELNFPQSDYLKKTVGSVRFENEFNAKKPKAETTRHDKKEKKKGKIVSFFDRFREKDKGEIDGQ